MSCDKLDLHRQQETRGSTPAFSDHTSYITIARVPDQNGASQALYIVEMHHSGRDPYSSG